MRDKYLDKWEKLYDAAERLYDDAYGMDENTINNEAFIVSATALEDLKKALDELSENEV